jgi:inhibitor of KinA sporulation pathway (predicted exonuclease)
VPSEDRLVARASADLQRAGGAILIDLEFTCWENSLRTGWADPARPAEVIEIGLAAYHLPARVVGPSFGTLVRPRVNPTLSAYCIDLVHITQEEIDAAQDLPTVLPEVAAWLRALPLDGVPTCGWGPYDRRRLAANAALAGAADPLAGRPHIDLEAVLAGVYRRREATISRDEVRALASLPPNPRRHRALGDALDLTHFLPLLLDASAR